MLDKKRQENEQKFKNWKPTDAGGRIYWYEVQGRHGWHARYVKEVDKNEKGVLVEIHEKYSCG